MATSNQQRSELVALIREYHERGVRGGLLRFLQSRAALSTARQVQSILRADPVGIAIEAGFRSGTYYRSEYSASGRGSFGRLGGSGRRGRHSPPSYYVD